MEPVVITDPAEVAGLEPGTPYVLDVGFNEPDHDPVAFSDAYREATKTVPQPDVNQPDRDAIKAKYTTTELYDLLKEHKVKGRTKIRDAGEDAMIAALLKAGVQL